MTTPADYWENEAKRYAGNADYWRARAQTAEQDAERYRELVEQLVACHEEPTCPAVELAQDMLAGREGPGVNVTG